MKKSTKIVPGIGVSKIEALKSWDQNLKKEGSILVATLFLSGLILILGLSAAALMARELNLATDVLYSERAYYAAEGGIERALIELNTSGRSIQHIKPKEAALAGFAGVSALKEDSFLAIDNIVDSGESFYFDLPSFGAQKFRFQADTDNGTGFSLQESANMIIKLTDPLTGLPVSTQFQWRFICQASDNRTYALVNSHIGDLGSLKTENGFVEDNDLSPVVAANVSFNSWTQVCSDFQTGVAPGCVTSLTLTSADKNTCFLSIQNLDNDPTPDKRIRFTVTPQGKAAPHSASVSARATAGSRTKVIEFDYLQKNLGGLFDFSFYHNR